jgi:hypothetical protein
MNRAGHGIGFHAEQQDPRASANVIHPRFHPAEWQRLRQ